MQINSTNWRPAIETIIKINDKLYFAAVQGVKIIECSHDGVNVLYSDNLKDDMWGAFHFSVKFNESIFFLSHRLNYAVKYDLEKQIVNKIELPVKEGERIVPFINGNHLMLIGLTSGNIYQYRANNSFEKMLSTDLKSKYWKTYRRNTTMHDLYVWNNEGNSVGYYNVKNNSFNCIDIPNVNILCAAGNEDVIYIISDSGNLHSIDCKTGNISSPTYISNSISDFPRLYLKNGKGYLFQSKGNKCFIFDENQSTNVTCNNIELELDNKKITWTVSEDKFIGIAETIELPWKNDIVFFEYDPVNNSAVKFPIENLIKNKIFKEKIHDGIILNETENYGLKQYIELFIEK